MELTPHDKEQFDALQAEIDGLYERLKDPHIAPNTRIQISDAIGGIISKRQAIIARNKPKDERTSTEVEIGNLLKKIDSTEEAIYSEIEQEEMFKRALGYKENSNKSSYKMTVLFNTIIAAQNRIIKLQNGEIDLDKERQEQLDQIKRDDAEETARFLKKVDDEKAAKLAYSKANWRSKTGFNREKEKSTPDVFTRYYFEQLQYAKGQELKKISNEEGLRMLWDPYIQRWYINDKREGDPKLNSVRDNLLPSDKNKIAIEWSDKIKDELNTKEPDERVLTKKIHKTAEPEFWKRAMSK